jgi:RNA-directed DNA polymerase
MTVPTENGTHQSTKLEGIGKRATFRKDTVFNNIGHVVDLDLLRASYPQLEGKKAVGIDGETKASYGEKLEDNLQGSFSEAPQERIQTPSLTAGRNTERGWKH